MWGNLLLSQKKGIGYLCSVHVLSVSYAQYFQMSCCELMIRQPVIKSCQYIMSVHHVIMDRLLVIMFETRCCINLLCFCVDGYFVCETFHSVPILFLLGKVIMLRQTTHISPLSYFLWGEGLRWLLLHIMLTWSDPVVLCIVCDVVKQMTTVPDHCSILLLLQHT